ncbi:uncharacterized protein DS421_2g52260 [Arachis hypogaea]|nr:uncharacterized protein DS421_2g52260 [Arachis hypogaea]
MADSSTSSTSQSHSEKTQPFHFRATFKTQDIQLVANIRKLHQHTIKLSIKNLQRKQSYNTQGVTVLVVLVLLQTKDLKCATHLLSDKFRNTSEEKKTIVRDLGFGGLMHIPPLRVHHQMLRELANNFKLGENRLETGYGSFKITPRKIGHALGINATGDLFSQKVDYKKLSEDDKVIFRRSQGKTLKSLTDEMMDIGVGNKEERLMFKRIFILYIQMAFLLPTTINKISHVETGGLVLTFIVKGITDYKEKKKNAIDGCLFALMIIYFHLSKNKGNKRAKRPPKPWIANWSKEQLVERMSAETEEILYVLNNDCLPSKMDSRKRKKSQEDSDSNSESESTDESEESSPVEKQKKKKKTQRTPKKTQSKKKKVVVEHSSPEEDQYYDGYSTLSEIGSEDLDELLRGNDEKSAAEGENEADLRSTEGRYVSSEMLSPVQQSASEPADSNMMVVREQTPSEVLAIVPIQVFVPVSQTTTVPEFEETPETNFEPTPLLQIEGTTKTTPEPPNNLKKAHPRFPQLQLKSAEDAATLMMMAQTASYVLRTDPLPSFSLALIDSSQEETATQEGASTQEAERAKSSETENLIEELENLIQKIASSTAKEESKSPQIQRETGGESSGKFETPAEKNQNTNDMKEKCYIWGTRVKTYADGNTNEYDNMCTLIAQDKYILTRMHLASLQAGSYIEAEIVSAMCLILNQKNDKRFQEQNMAISKHPNGEFISPKTNKEFRVEDYPSFIPFIDAKKLTSHPYGYVISRMRAYAGGEPLKKDEKEKEIKASYVNIPGQKSTYDCAIYVMKWLELIEPENIKRGKYEWDNWKQDEVDHYRVEYASRILFSEMNKERDQAIRASNAIRLSKPSSVLLSLFC